MTVKSEDLLSSVIADLASQGLPTGGSDWASMSVRDAAALNLVRSLLSKLRVGHTAATNKAASDKFLAVNKSCKEWTLPLDKDGNVQIDSKTEIILGQLRTELDDFWHKRGQCLVDHPFEILDNARLGPGVNIGSRGESFYAKLFSSPLTCSRSALYEWYQRYARGFAEWSNAENIRKENYGEAVIVEQSRLSFVPKNDKISRCICIEPTLNTYFQLGLGQILERRLAERFGISLATQPFRNRALARLGSITDGLSTIDLSSASDSISLKMLRWLLPPSFVRMLEFCRSDNIEIPGEGTVPLHMVSTMGNGFTFPLQTILFASVVTACLSFRGIPRTSDKSDELWGVFGDDIICPRSVTSDVISILGILGFKVNGDKSFVEGPFRESCGSDFFLGSDIRGVYVKTLDTLTSRYAVLNQLIRFSTKTCISLDRTLNLLYRSLGKKPLRVPRWEDMSSGIHVPFSLAETRWCQDTYSHEYKCLVARSRSVRIRDTHVVVPKGKKRLIYNPSGLLLSFLQQSVKCGAIGVRDNSVEYRTRRRITSRWDDTHYPLWESNDFGMDWRRWESVVSDLIER